jgi:lipoprotein-anchoring transpeptidase ErfK/SrfK
VSKHRAGARHRQRARAVNRHRAEVRPRYGRIATLVSSLAVTVVAALGGAGLLPSWADDTEPAAAIDRSSATSVEESTDDPASNPEPSEAATPRSGSTTERREKPKRSTKAAPATQAQDTALPADSGEGKRIVFSEGRQRVWLVDEASSVVRTYLVSGSVYDNLEPGTFRVYSRSENAVGIDDSGTMRYFVRFTTGTQGAAIGFHDIPIDDGKLVQTVAQLGTPQSHGCIRQDPADAIALWEFAPIGTTVVVTA